MRVIQSNSTYGAQIPRGQPPQPDILKIENLPRTAGFHFTGVTAGGREIPCTVGEDGSFHADTHEVCRLTGWRA